MNRKVFLLPAIVMVLAGQLYAGGVWEMSTKNKDGATTVANRMYAQAGKLRMDQLDAKGSLKTSAIFQNNEMIMVDHAQKKFYRIDEKTLAELGAQMQKVREAMKKMEEQMANMPPQQRQMMEKMMKGRMGAMAGMGAKRPVLRVEAQGTGTWKTYSCKNYAVFTGDQKTQEVCAAPASSVEGADEFMQAAKSMQEFFEKFKEALQFEAFANLSQNPAEVIGEVDGFPVHTKQFANGTLQEERFLTSAKSESLSDATFSAPSGYKEEKINLKGRKG